MSKTIYEYLLKDGKVIKLTHTDTKEFAPGKYKFKAGLSKHYAYIHEDDFDSVIKNHLFSFEDNIEKFKIVFISHYKISIRQTEIRLEQYKKILQKLEEK